MSLSYPFHLSLKPLNPLNLLYTFPRMYDHLTYIICRIFSVYCLPPLPPNYMNSILKKQEFWSIFSPWHLKLIEDPQKINVRINEFANPDLSNILTWASYFWKCNMLVESSVIQFAIMGVKEFPFGGNCISHQLPWGCFYQLWKQVLPFISCLQEEWANISVFCIRTSSPPERFAVPGRSCLLQHALLAGCAICNRKGYTQSLVIAICIHGIYFSLSLFFFTWPKLILSLSASHLDQIPPQLLIPALHLPASPGTLQEPVFKDHSFSPRTNGQPKNKEWTTFQRNNTAESLPSKNASSCLQKSKPKY